MKRCVIEKISFELSTKEFWKFLKNDPNFEANESVEEIQSFNTLEEAKKVFERKYKFTNFHKLDTCVGSEIVVEEYNLVQIDESKDNYSEENIDCSVTGFVNGLFHKPLEIIKTEAEKFFDETKVTLSNGFEL